MGFSSGVASQVHLASTLYIDSQDDLDVDLCFLEDHDIGVFPK
jgi:hypothetical protein